MGTNGELRIFNPKLNAKLDKISKVFSQFHDIFEIKECKTVGPWIRLKLKPKGDTRAERIRRNIKNAQFQLKFRRMHLEEQDTTLYLYVTDEDIKYPGLTDVLTNHKYSNAFEEMELPHVIGFGIPNTLFIGDLAKSHHLLLGGSTDSGKSVGMQSLVASIAYKRSPSKVTLILINVVTDDFMCFEGLPHLACPIIHTREEASRALSTLRLEMERRSKFEYADQDAFAAFPRVVLVIDEVSALFEELDKDELKLVYNNLSDLLRRGRHGRIHVVAADQDPTKQEIKVSTTNFRAKIAFKTDRWQNSVTIMGTSGAEKLSGNGELLLKSPQFNGIQKLQGVYASYEELCQLVQQIKTRPYQPSEYNNKFIIAEDTLRTTDSGSCRSDMLPATTPKPTVEDQTFAKALLWAFSQDSISVNQLKINFGKGWSTADRYVAKMEEKGIVEPLNAKLPRCVIPTDIRLRLKNKGCTKG